jgi:hypothetical protein
MCLQALNSPDRGRNGSTCQAPRSLEFFSKIYVLSSIGCPLRARPGALRLDSSRVPVSRNAVS